MKVILLLRKIGLISVADVEAVTHTSVETRTVSMQDLLEQAEKNRQQNPGASAPEFLVGFEQMFDALKVTTPEHGFTAEKAAEILASASDKNPKETLQTAMKEKNVPAEEVINDALKKDQALDSYEEFAYKKLVERSSARQQEKENLKRRIEECESRMKELSLLESADEQAFQDWVKKKVKKEEDLYNVVSALTSDNQISVGRVKNESKQQNQS